MDQGSITSRDQQRSAGLQNEIQQCRGEVIILSVNDPAADDGVGNSAFADRSLGECLCQQQVISRGFVRTDVAHVDEPLHVHLFSDI